MWNRHIHSPFSSHFFVSLTPFVPPGLISRVLAAEDPKSIVGVDISQGMVDQYNKIVFDHGIPPEEMRAVCVPPHERLQGMTFDVIVVSDPNRDFGMDGSPTPISHTVCICVSSFRIHRRGDHDACLNVFKPRGVAARRRSCSWRIDA